MVLNSSPTSNDAALYAAQKTPNNWKRRWTVLADTTKNTFPNTKIKISSFLNIVKKRKKNPPKKIEGGRKWGGEELQIHKENTVHFHLSLEKYFTNRYVIFIWGIFTEVSSLGSTISFPWYKTYWYHEANSKIIYTQFETLLQTFLITLIVPSYSLLTLLKSYYTWLPATTYTRVLNHHFLF